LIETQVDSRKTTGKKSSTKLTSSPKRLGLKKELTNFLAALDYYIKGSLDQAKSIDAIILIAILLMQKYIKLNIYTQDCKILKRLFSRIGLICTNFCIYFLLY
ncbi:hypothetical protein DPV78_000144, partial [Talaromyces pinophilus]